MDINIIFRVKIKERDIEIKQTYNITPGATFGDLLSPSNKVYTEDDYYLNAEFFTFSHYYRLSGYYWYNFPFVIEGNDRLKWNVPYKEALVLDFIKTHQINGNTIETDYLIPETGGWFEGEVQREALELWIELKPIIIQVLSTTKSIKDAYLLLRWLLSMFKSKKAPTPHALSDFFYTREMWNHYELAILLDVSPDYAKSLLVVFGFKWDAGKRIYVKDQKLADIYLNALSNIKLYKVESEEIVS